MFSIFVFTFSALVSFWASRYFFLLWKKNKYDPYWEFGIFFFILAIAFAVCNMPFFTKGLVASLSGEVGIFLIVFSFAFVLRAFLRFQEVKAVSPNFITLLVIAIDVVKFAVGVYFPPAPVFKDGLLYWHFSVFSAVGHAILIGFFTLAVGITLLSNIKNIRKHQRSILFLGLAFLVGGLSAIFIPNFNTFVPLLSGYVLLLITSIFIGLSTLTLSRERTSIN